MLNKKKLKRIRIVRTFIDVSILLIFFFVIAFGGGAFLLEIGLVERPEEITSHHEYSIMLLIVLVQTSCFYLFSKHAKKNPFTHVFVVASVYVTFFIVIGLLLGVPSSWYYEAFISTYAIMLAGYGFWHEKTYGTLRQYLKR